MRSRFLTGVTMMAVLAGGLAPAPLTIAYAKPGTSQQGFCRNADPLPRLDTEAQAPSPRVNSGIKTKGEKRMRAGAAREDSAVVEELSPVYAPEPPMPPPPPPPPPPPMAPPPPSYEPPPVGSTSEVVVTGSARAATDAGSSKVAAPPGPGSSSD